MSPSDRTQLGGSSSRFQTTCWSELRGLAGLNDAQRRDVLGRLIVDYWKPVYCYLRRRGHDNETAKDLTQGFFHEIVVGRHLAEQADETRGRFRTLLLTALDRYVVSVHRKQSAAKRRPAERTVSLDENQDIAARAAVMDMGPDEAFTYAWAVQLLQEVLVELRRGCEEDGKELHWQLFNARVVEPIISGGEPEALSQLCERLGVDTPVKAENMIVTVRRRFRTLMRSRVREHVASDDDVDQEIRELMAILSR